MRRAVAVPSPYKHVASLGNLELGGGFGLPDDLDRTFDRLVDVVATGREAMAAMGADEAVVVRPGPGVSDRRR